MEDFRDRQFKTLRTMGLVNSDLGITLGHLASKRKRAMGFCTGGYYTAINKYGQPYIRPKSCNFKTGDKALDFCPKCGNALFWKSVTDRGDDVGGDAQESR